MGLLEAIPSGIVYLDTNIWIYTLENYAAYSQDLTALFQAIDNGTLKAITSELTLAEILVAPIQREDAAQQEICKQFIRNTETLSVLPISQDVLIEAAKVRARTSIKLPDAIHLATAIGAGCTAFLTNDRQLKKVTDIPVILLSDVVAS